jgi:hypothetical protein
VIGDQVGVMGGGVPRRRERLHRRIAEPDALAVVERDVLELDVGADRQVRRGSRARHQLGQPRDVVGLHMRLEHRDDRNALHLGERHVLLDEIHVRIDHRELALALAAQQVGGTSRVVVEQLPEVHGLTSYQAIY